MPKFAYKELDQEGMETLQTIAAADKFNRWMFETVRAHLIPGNVLEVGSGIGNISAHFLEEGYDITLSDIRENYCGFLEEHFRKAKTLRDIVKLDLVHPEFEREYAPYLGQFDNLYALNVVEHIEDDTLALENCRKLLRPGGRLIILVPAYQWLYNNFDRALYHYRRYTRRSLKAVFQQSGFRVRKAFHFNFIGIAGWFVSGTLLRKELIPSGQMKLYNTLVPIFRLIDRMLLRQVGLSVIVVGDA
ncbi:MAG: class I SAM-dependent methyltransferase [Bacteroidetes bacterium]|nr:MAG: class I SAM-dependent methyltransferase [Bacteroidota bacterium]